MQKVAVYILAMIIAIAGGGAIGALLGLIEAAAINGLAALLNLKTHIDYVEFAAISGGLVSIVAAGLMAKVPGEEGA